MAQVKRSNCKPATQAVCSTCVAVVPCLAAVKAALLLRLLMQWDISSVFTTALVGPSLRRCSAPPFGADSSETSGFQRGVATLTRIAPSRGHAASGRVRCVSVTPRRPPVHPADAAVFHRRKKPPLAAARPPWRREPIAQGWVKRYLGRSGAAAAALQFLSERGDGSSDIT